MAREPKRRVLLVDDEEVLAWSLANRLAKVRANLAVETANDGETALSILQSPVQSKEANQARVDLLVADIRMPGMSGIDLVLSARSIYPDLPVVVMTAFRSADVQRLNEGPFTGFLEKPFEFERLVELVDEALTPTPTVGFSGAISVQTLPDVVQLYVLSSATGMLSVKHRTGRGEMWFSQGAILHAVTAQNRGDEAFFEIMMWSGGEFGMSAGALAPERSIQSSWQELLIESCRRIDEAHRAGSVTSSRRGWTRQPPPSNDVEELDLDAALEHSLNFQTLVPGGIEPVTNIDQPIIDSPLEVPMNIKDSLAKLNQMDGFVGAALVDGESGMLLGSEGGSGMNLEVAAAGNTEVVKAKRKTMQNLQLKENIEDILITLNKQYHLIRPLRARTTLFFYVALDRTRANLAMARIALADVEKDLQV